jgi:hypothetical protein
MCISQNLTSYSFVRPMTLRNLIKDKGVCEDHICIHLYRSINPGSANIRSFTLIPCREQRLFLKSDGSCFWRRAQVKTKAVWPQVVQSLGTCLHSGNTSTGEMKPRFNVLRYRKPAIKEEILYSK